MFLGAIWIYLGATRARGLAGKISIGSLVVLVGAVYAFNLLGPPPPAEAIGKLALSAWLLIPWAWWIERTRSTV